MDAIGAYTPEQARELWQDYLSRRRQNPQTQQNYPIRRPIEEFRPRTRRATINEDLTAPTSPLAAMTSADLYFINLLDDGTSELDDSGPYTVYNDDPDFTCERGTLLRVEWLGGRWMIYWAACAPNDALITALDAL